MTRGVVFDMDDTLYLEADYVRSGFAHVARLIGRDATEAERLERWLADAFDAGVRRDTFDRLLSAFPDLAHGSSVADLVAAYRAHVPSIVLSADVRRVLDSLMDRKLRLGVLSDGPLISQSAKANALELDHWFDPVLLTDALGEGFAKPSTKGFETIAEVWDLAPDELVYVADNPEKDFAAPQALGWRTIRLRKTGQLRASLEPRDDTARPDVEISEFEGVPDAIR